MTLDSPPEPLTVSYDLHGLRCEVRPQRMRPLWLQAMVQQGIRDARHSEEPAPVALLGMLEAEDQRS